MMIWKYRNPVVTVFAMFSLMLTGTARAHFIWLVPESNEGTTTVQVYFSEEASPDDPDLLDRLKDLAVRQVQPGGDAVTLPLTFADGEIRAETRSSGNSFFVAAHDLRVFDRGDAVFRLKYYAKSGPAISHPAWTQIDCTSLLRLDVVPTINGNRLEVRVRFDGRPVAGAEVKASGPAIAEFTGATDDEGRIEFSVEDPGLYSIRARHIEEAAGEIEGKKYPATRHYSTVAVDVAGASPPAAATSHHLAPLPEPVTSFGAAICDGYLYTYGGHTGSAHSYSVEEQGHELRRIALSGGEWETVAEGPRLQGLALVTHGGKLYRIGGFTAKNHEGEEHDLWSQTSVASYDPATETWSDLPPLPEPRSSHDAAVVGDTIYVVGGWAMGDGETKWHETAWRMDLAATELAWKPVPAPPFPRRALATAAHDGKLYIIGGMQQEGGSTTRTDIFDPQSEQWSQGPSLAIADAASGDQAENGDPGRGSRNRSSGGMTGFGASAFATGGQLYASTVDGNLQRLAENGSAWEIVAETPTARFFHRLLPVDESHLLVVGGANMGIGKFDEVEILEVPGNEEEQE